MIIMVKVLWTTVMEQHYSTLIGTWSGGSIGCLGINMFFFPASGCKPNIQASNGHQGGTNAGALQHWQRHRDLMQKAQALQDHLLLLPGPHVPQLRVDLTYSCFSVISSGVYVDMYGYVVFSGVYVFFSRTWRVWPSSGIQCSGMLWEIHGRNLLLEVNKLNVATFPTVTVEQHEWLCSSSILASPFQNHSKRKTFCWGNLR